MAGCSEGPVTLDEPRLDDADAAACADFVDALPDTLADQARREVQPEDTGAGAAWGDPAIVVTCGVGTPPGFSRASSCEVANGVGWYVPPEQYDDQGLDVTFTAVGYAPSVELVLPAEYRPNGGAAAIAELAAPVKENLRLQERCR